MSVRMVVKIQTFLGQQNPKGFECKNSEFCAPQKSGDF